MASDHRTYCPLILFTVILLITSSPSNSEEVSLKRPVTPCSNKKSYGIQVINDLLITDTKDKVKVVRKFETGTNSTILWIGENADLYCDLCRGNDTERFKVAWRLKEDGEYYLKSDLESLVSPDKFDYFENTTLTRVTIFNVNTTDKGWYQCALWDTNRCRHTLSNLSCVISTFEIQLRIKDRMDKIYPSVSIGVEVVLLFIIIVVYETRKSKTEVEESDTDGSPDQKNVSDTNGEGLSEATRLAKD